MIVPLFWAESRAQHREKGRQVTVRRFGWSNTSQQEAQVNADSRTADALRRLLTGEKVPRRDLKRAYNGSDGVPIREEVVDRVGETVITRNCYGARCLNTPNVLFADIDFRVGPSGLLAFFAFVGVIVAISIACGSQAHSSLVGVGIIVLELLFRRRLVVALDRAIQLVRGTPENRARNRIRRFLEDRPEWNVRLYRTPAGMRVLATHRTYSPSDPAVAECFSALKVDPIYRRMCLKQQCFRARLTAKPWRIGIGGHFPAHGVWPVAAEHLPARRAWIERYEAAAASFSACALLETLGSGITNREAMIVQQLHDQQCRATARLPLA